jgi:hypothetical protein
MPGSWCRRTDAEGTGATLLIRRNDRRLLGGLLLVIAILWLAAAVRGFVAGDPAIIPGLGAAGAYIAGALGAAFAVVALEWMVRVRTVAIGRGMVAVTARSLRGRGAWHEPLASYRGLGIVREQRQHRYGARSWYVVRLCHPEAAKTIELARAKDPTVIELRARDYADGLGLPLSSHRAEATEEAHDAARRREVAATTVAGEPLSSPREEATGRGYEAARRSGAAGASVAGEQVPAG